MMYKSTPVIFPVPPALLAFLTLRSDRMLPGVMAKPCAPPAVRSLVVFAVCSRVWFFRVIRFREFPPRPSSNPQRGDDMMLLAGVLGDGETSSVETCGVYSGVRIPYPTHGGGPRIPSLFHDHAVITLCVQQESVGETSRYCSLRKTLVHFVSNRRWN